MPKKIFAGLALFIAPAAAFAEPIAVTCMDVGGAPRCESSAGPVEITTCERYDSGLIACSSVIHPSAG